MVGREEGAAATERWRTRDTAPTIKGRGEGRRGGNTNFLIFTALIEL